MSDWLPDIDIAIEGEARAFLEQMANIGRASKRFDVEHHQDALGIAGYDAVNFRLRDSSPHQDLSFQLLTRPEAPSPVAVEVRAGRWDPAPPTYAVYCEAARGLAGPMLAALNRENSTRYRLRIERSTVGRFKTSQRTVLLLDRFALLANKSSLHPLDWNRFYQLVHESRQQIPEPEMRSLLGRRGFSRESAQNLAELYVHLWAFKRLR